LKVFPRLNFVGFMEFFLSGLIPLKIQTIF
jgi:hypothetical protein